MLGRSGRMGCSFGEAGEGRVAEGKRAFSSSSPECRHRQSWWPGPLFRSGPVKGSSYINDDFPEKHVNGEWVEMICK